MLADACEQLPARIQSDIGIAPFHTWVLPGGEAWTEFYHLDEGYLLRFPQLADFSLLEDGLQARCYPVPGTDRATWEHLFLNQVLPLALGKRGKLVFHAAAVEAGEHAIAFMGESGRGKSTLAAGFSVSGTRFLTDDGLVLEPVQPLYRVLPSHPSIRLWSDSEEAIFAHGCDKAASVPFTSKSRFLAGGDIRFCEQPRSLRRVYYLGDGSAGRLEICPVSAADAVLELVKHSFLLDIEAQSSLATHFDQVAALANQPIHYRLDFPRRFDQLPGVLDAIVDHANDGGLSQ